MALQSQQPIGQSEIFHTLMDRVSDVASLQTPVLLVGERGTGKELIASRLHFLSPRWERVYVTLNCAAYSDTELEVALFDENGGAFVRAEGGTLFLDHIESCAPHLQEKLLSLLETGFPESGASPDVRLICASGVDLPSAASSGQFRADLIDQIAFTVLSLPPLRIRPDDVPPLVEHFGRRNVSALGAERFPGFSAEAMAVLMSHNWPGNVRELKRVVERSISQAYLVDETLSAVIHALVLDPFASPYRLGPASGTAPDVIKPAQADGSTIVTGDIIGEPIADFPNADFPSADFSARVTAFERGLIDEAMRGADHHQGRAAKHLGLSYHQFRGLLRKHGLKK